MNTNSARVARRKANLRTAGGRVLSLALEPESVKAAEYLVQQGWASSITAALNLSVQRLAQAQALLNNGQKGEDHGSRD